MCVCVCFHYGNFISFFLILDIRCCQSGTCLTKWSLFYIKAPSHPTRSSDLQVQPKLVTRPTVSSLQLFTTQYHISLLLFYIHNPFLLMPLKTLAVAAGESLQSPSFHSKKPQPPTLRSPHNDARRFQPDSLSKQALTTDQPIHVVHEEEDFYTSLEKHSALYRIVLDRPLTSSVPLEEWVRLDLQMVNEYGLILRKERAHNCRVSLHVKLLAQSTGYALRDASHYQLEVRPVQYDNWDTNSDTSVNTYTTTSNSSMSDSSSSLCSTPDDDTSFIFTPDILGFQSSGKASLEFRITGDIQYSTKTKYFLYIAPAADDNAIQALPSVLGPVQLVPQEQSYPTLQDRMILGGVDTEALNRVHRVYDISHLVDLNHRFPSLHHKFFVVKENWRMATWGKAWDAALVLSDLLAKRVMNDPYCLSGRHVIDISAG